MSESKVIAQKHDRSLVFYIAIFFLMVPVPWICYLFSCAQLNLTLDGLYDFLKCFYGFVLPLPTIFNLPRRLNHPMRTQRVHLGVLFEENSPGSFWERANTQNPTAKSEREKTLKNHNFQLFQNHYFGV